MKKQLSICAFSILILLLLQFPAWGMDNGNPANLALPGTHFELLFEETNIQASNNLINLGNINLDMTDPAVKEDFLGRMEAGYFKLNADVDLETGLTIGRLQLRARPWTGATVCLAPGWTDLVFKGYEPNKTYDFEGTTINGISAVSLDLSYGHPLLVDEPYSLGIGATFHYLRGLALGGVEFTSGSIVSDEYAQAEYQMTGRAYSSISPDSLENGFALPDASGYVFDVGLVYKNERLTAGLVVKNIGKGIAWKDVTTWDATAIGTLNGGVNGVPDYSDYTIEESTAENVDITTKIPIVLGITADYKLIPRHFTVHLGFEKGFKDSWGISSTPRYSAGLDWETLKFLRFAGEAGLQGRQLDFQVTSELRLWFLWFSTTLGWTGNFSPISDQTTGFSVASSARIHF